MTIIFNVEITAQFTNDDVKIETAEKSVLDPELKSAWEKKVGRAFEKYIKDANVVCTDIKVFPTN